MRFWSDRTLQPNTQTIFNETPSPTGISYRIVKTESEKREISKFLKAHFKKSPSSPEYIQPLNDSTQTILYMIEPSNTSNIIASIRYKYIGTNQANPIHCIDCFCIHPQWRKKGIGTYLLASLHNEVIQRIQSVFLKEGSLLPINHAPFYSSTYVYRHNINPPLHSKHVSIIPTALAHKLVNIFLEFNPQTFLILNPDSQNQKWLYYKDGTKWALALILDTYQTIHGQKMGWITGYIHSPNINTNESHHIIDILSDYSGYSYIWTDIVWASHWKVDGPYHWYSYYWNPPQVTPLYIFTT